MIKTAAIQLSHPFYPGEWEWCFWERKNSEDQASLLINIPMADHLALLPKISSIKILIYGLLESMVYGVWFPEEITQIM